MESLDLALAGDLLSVCGALLIFFSWITNNTFGEKLKKNRLAYDEANQRRRLFGQLNMLASSLESVAAETITVRKLLIEQALNAESVAPHRRDHLQTELTSVEIASKSLNARQLDWLLKFCEAALEESSVDKIPSPANEKLTGIRDTLRTTCKQKDLLIADMRQLLADKDTYGAGEAYERIEAKRTELYNLMDPALPQMYKAAVEDSDERTEELRSAVSRAKWRVKFATRSGLVLYALGTLAIINGTALDKFQAQVGSEALDEASSPTVAASLQ